MRYDLTYLSLGAGAQSTALYILSTLGQHGVPRADVAVFADTGDEPDYVYAQLHHLDYWRACQQPERRIPIEIVSAGVSLSEAMKARWIPIPAFTQSGKREGMLRRQCTKEFKIVPIQRFIKETVLGVPRGRVVRQRVRSMMGFSAEEVMRIKPSREQWIDSVYPLIDARLFRPQCMEIVERNIPKLGIPRKSACTFCPFHSDRFWAEMKRDNPEAFEHACQVDDMIRSAEDRADRYEAARDGRTQSSIRLQRSTDGITADAIYVHRSCRPLRDVEFGDQPSLWGAECEGHCGV